MSFIALSTQKSVLTLQKNFLQLNKMSITNQVQKCAAQMAELTKAAKQEYGDDYDVTESAQYQYYEQMDEQLETESDMIDTQLTAINEQINGLKTLINNNIKSTCALNLAGG